MRKAFTLIELLVVIAIIGTLAALVLVSITNARAKTRDTQRKSDINQIAKALEMYYGDNEKYPIIFKITLPSTGILSNSTYAYNNSTVDNDATKEWDEILTPRLQPNYIRQIPTDPINNNSYYYVYYSDFKVVTQGYGTMFSISAAKLENLNDPQRCESQSYHLYTLTNFVGTVSKIMCVQPTGGPVDKTYGYGISSQQQ